MFPWVGMVGIMFQLPPEKEWSIAAFSVTEERGYAGEEDEDQREKGGRDIRLYLKLKII